MPSDPEHISAWQRLDGRTTTSGMLRPENVAELAAIGVRHVINLSLTDSPGALPGEAGLMADAGLSYTHIPVPFDAPQASHYDAFVAALEASEGPVHVHCIMNWRVSAFFCRYNRDQRGMAESEARALMARQWNPWDNDNKDAPAWARFIEGENGS